MSHTSVDGLDPFFKDARRILFSFFFLLFFLSRFGGESDEHFLLFWGCFIILLCAVGWLLGGGGQGEGVAMLFSGCLLHSLVYAWPQTALLPWLANHDMRHSRCV